MKKLTAIGFIICIILILFLSGQSGSQAFGMTYRLALPIANIIYDTPDYDQILLVMNGIRLFGRVIAFTAFGVFFTALIHVWGKKLPPRVKNSLSFLGIVIFGIFDEMHKLRIDGRHCTIAEIIVNIICGFIGMALALYVVDKYRRT